jgi:hypothetical protein
MGNSINCVISLLMMHINNLYDPVDHIGKKILPFMRIKEEVEPDISPSLTPMLLSWLVDNIIFFFNEQLNSTTTRRTQQWWWREKQAHSEEFTPSNAKKRKTTLSLNIPSKQLSEVVAPAADRSGLSNCQQILIQSNVVMNSGGTLNSGCHVNVSFHRLAPKKNRTWKYCCDQ